MSEEKLIHREFQAELTPTGDGRNVDVRIIPYGTVARVSDDHGRTFYEEQWEPGVFDHLKNAANRIQVLANFEHQKGIGGFIARGTELRDSEQALEGTFRMLNHPDADKALELVTEGVLTGVSIEAIPQKSVREDGVVKRVKAKLVNIAFCREPAFPDAAVLAVREKQDEVTITVTGGLSTEQELVSAIREKIIEAAEPPERSDVDEVLARIGWEPLISRAVTKKPWDSSPARFEDEEYQRSCLIDRGGDAPVKERCSLPVLEPNGDINVNALDAAAGRLNQTKAPAELKAKAARKLVRYYNTAKMPPPASVKMLASR